MLTSERFEGAPRGTRQRRECTLVIPETEEEPNFLIWAPLQPMLKHLSGSYTKGKMMSVEYKLKLYVRFGNLWKSVAKTGFNIEVVPNPVVIPDGRYLEVPVNWNPHILPESIHAMPIPPPVSIEPVAQLTSRSNQNSISLLTSPQPLGKHSRYSSMSRIYPEGSKI